MPTPSDKHSDCYFHLKNRIIEMKNGATTIITPAPMVLTPEQAKDMFRMSLHEFVNAEYTHDHGLTEDEAELLHAIINNEVAISTDGHVKPRPPMTEDPND